MARWIKWVLRLATVLLPLLLALLHVTGVQRLEWLNRLEAAAYDARLLAVMPRTLDERIVILDIDEKSLAELGHWPWPRHHLARLVERLFEERSRELHAARRFAVWQQPMRRAAWPAKLLTTLRPYRWRWRGG